MAGILGFEPSASGLTDRPDHPGRLMPRGLEREAGVEPVIFAVEVLDPEPLDDTREMVPTLRSARRSPRLQRGALTIYAIEALLVPEAGIKPATSGLSEHSHVVDSKGLFSAHACRSDRDWE